MSCQRGLTQSEIMMEFGSDDSMKKCTGCSELHYEDGIMTCKELTKGKSSKKDD